MHYFRLSQFRFFFLFLAGIPNFAAHAQTASLGTFVVVGDSLTAGFQNFSLYTAPSGGQQYGYAQIIAQQAGTDLLTPIISYPGIPPVLVTDALGEIERSTGFGFRLNPVVQTLNLSVPSYTVADALSRTIDLSPLNTNPVDILTQAVLAYPGLLVGNPCGSLSYNYPNLTISSVACAVQLHPQTILVSLGNNDALQALTFGLPPTPSDTFQTLYHEMLGRLAQTQAHIFLANVPDVTAIPYLWSSQDFQNKCGFSPGGASAADYIVTNLVDLYNPSGNVCKNYAIRPAELVQQAQQAVVAYNAIIAQEAAAVNATVIDLNGLVADLARNGTVVWGRKLTTSFGGGLFSLDGIHPTNTGYAILANEAIRTINGKLGTSISPVAVVETAKSDPLLPPR